MEADSLYKWIFLSDQLISVKFFEIAGIGILAQIFFLLGSLLFLFGLGCVLFVRF